MGGKLSFEAATSKLDIRVDLRACRGRRQCIYRAPATFKTAGRNKATVRDPNGDDVAVIRAAAAACPRFAIKLTSAEAEKKNRSKT